MALGAGRGGRGQWRWELEGGGGQAQRALGAGRRGGAGVHGAGSWPAYLSPAVLELLHMVFPVGPVWAPPPSVEASRASKLLTWQHPRRTRHQCSAFLCPGLRKDIVSLHPMLLVESHKKTPRFKRRVET